MTSPGPTQHAFPSIAPEDTYLISFPRSGSTWLRCLLTSLLCGGPVTPAVVQAVTPDVYVSLRTGASKPKLEPLIIKSHAVYAPLAARVIYLVRDGRAALASYSRYAQNIPAPSLYDEFAEISDFYFREDLWPAPWHTHVNGWLDGLGSWDSDRYLVVRYEDALESPTSALRNIAQLVGLDASSAEVERAVELNSREKLIQLEAEAGAGSLNFIPTEASDASGSLAPSELQRYEQLAWTALRRCGYL